VRTGTRVDSPVVLQAHPAKNSRIARIRASAEKL